MSDPALLSEALVVWTGKAVASWPARDDDRLVERYGEETALELLPQIRELVADFDSSDARLTAPDLQSMGDAAAGEFRRLHPEIDDNAVEALAWCYTFDNK